MKNTIKNLKNKIEAIATSLDDFMWNNRAAWIAVIAISNVIEILWWARRF